MEIIRWVWSISREQRWSLVILFVQLLRHTASEDQDKYWKDGQHIKNETELQEYRELENDIPL